MLPDRKWILWKNPCRAKWGWHMDVLLAGDQDPKKRMRKRGEGIGEFQIQGRLTELMSQVVLKMQ